MCEYEKFRDSIEYHEFLLAHEDYLLSIGFDSISRAANYSILFSEFLNDIGVK